MSDPMQESAVKPPHHPVFNEYPCFRGEAEDGIRLDFLGGRTRTEWFKPKAGSCPARFEETAYPPFNEQYLEWIDLLVAVGEAKGKFTMVELGAGWGRWVVRAALALRHKGISTFRLVAVEAEPTHFRWMREHFRDNGLNPDEHVLIEAAVGAADGQVRFAVGNADTWFGQHIVPEARAAASAGFWARLKRFLRPAAPTTPPVETRAVECVCLATILEPLEHVDYIDADIQGSEADVFEAAATQLDAKVTRVHIGTHSHAVEERLRALFSRLSWRPEFDHPCSTDSMTPWGVIRFGDGVQAWRNPRF